MSPFKYRGGEEGNALSAFKAKFFKATPAKPKAAALEETPEQKANKERVEKAMRQEIDELISSLAPVLNKRMFESVVDAKFDFKSTELGFARWGRIVRISNALLDNIVYSNETMLVSDSQKEAKRVITANSLTDALQVIALGALLFFWKEQQVWSLGKDMAVTSVEVLTKRCLEYCTGISCEAKVMISLIARGEHRNTEHVVAKVLTEALLLDDKVPPQFNESETATLLSTNKVYQRRCMETRSNNILPAWVKKLADDLDIVDGYDAEREERMSEISSQSCF
jgi:hypothetical protein